MISVKGARSHCLRRNLGMGSVSHRVLEELKIVLDDLRYFFFSELKKLRSAVKYTVHFS